MWTRTRAWRNCRNKTDTFRECSWPVESVLSVLPPGTEYSIVYHPLKTSKSLFEAFSGLSVLMVFRKLQSVSCSFQWHALIREMRLFALNKCPFWIGRTGSKELFCVGMCRNKRLTDKQMRTHFHHFFISGMGFLKWNWFNVAAVGDAGSVGVFGVLLAQSPHNASRFAMIEYS